VSYDRNNRVPKRLPTRDEVTIQEGRASKTMTSRRLLGACTGAALAGCTIAATAAVAAPPEFSPPFPNAFNSTSKAMTLETIGKFKVTCEADTNQGEVTGPATALLTITFTGCTTGEGPSGGSCQNVSSSGEIVTNRVSGTLGYLNRKHTAVGLDLSNPTGGPMVSFSCGEDEQVEVSGSLIGRITPINKVVGPGGHLTLKFVQREGHQAIKKLLGGPRDVTMTKNFFGPLEESGISSAELLAFGAPIEIVA
jgi:hypothetical protein